MKLRRLAGYGPALVLMIALLAVWQLYVQFSQISHLFLPSPGASSRRWSNNWPIIYDNTRADHARNGAGHHPGDAARPRAGDSAGCFELDAPGRSIRCW